MAMKRIKKVSQSADLAATIHSAFNKGEDIHRAIDTAQSRYPGLPAKTISTMANKVYTQRSTLGDFFQGNMGAFTNPLKAFGCTGDSIRFTTYATFLDADTGLPKEFWIDTVVTFEKTPIHKSDLVWFLYNEGINRAKQQGYNPRQLISGATATELLASGVLKITGFHCV